MSKFSQEGATVPVSCVFVHTDRQTHTTTDISTSLIISSDVHFVPLAEIKMLFALKFVFFLRQIDVKVYL